MNNWWAGALIWMRKGRKIYFLVQDVENLNPYYPNDTETKVLFPGGRSEDHPEDITPLDTLRRELLEEIWVELLPGERRIIHEEQKSKYHVQFF